MRDWIESATLFCLIAGVIGGALYGLYRLYESDRVAAIDRRCSAMAWRAAQTAGIEAGKATYAACRKDA